MPKSCSAIRNGGTEVLGAVRIEVVPGQSRIDVVVSFHRHGDPAVRRHRREYGSSATRQRHCRRAAFDHFVIFGKSGESVSIFAGVWIVQANDGISGACFGLLYGVVESMRAGRHVPQGFTGERCATVPSAAAKNGSRARSRNVVIAIEALAEERFLRTAGGEGIEAEQIEPSSKLAFDLTHGKFFNGTGGQVAPLAPQALDFVGEHAAAGLRSESIEMLPHLLAAILMVGVFE